MTKKQLAEIIGNKTGLTTDQAASAIDAYNSTIIDTLRDGNSVFMRGFGTFKPVLRREKKARRITEGTEIIVPAHRVFNFKPSKAVKNLDK